MTDQRPGSGPKWSCDYCTYENWPASKKCTLCRAPRQLQYINEEAPAAEQDIYKIAPLVSTGSNNRSPTGSTVMVNQCLDPKNKWACQACTYLNWPRAIRCTQCFTPRIKAIPIITSSTTQPLSININIAEPLTSTAASHSGSLSRRNSPKTSPNSPEAAKTLNNDINRAVATNKTMWKWICKACTYENWPKTNKCVLCGVVKGKVYTDSGISPLILSSLTSSPSSPASLSSVSGRVTSGRMTSAGNRSGSPSDSDSPPALSSPTSRPTSSTGRRNKRSPSSTPHSPASRSLENMEVIGATASPTTNQEYQDKSTHTQPGASNVKTGDNKVNKLRSHIRDLDWLWLNACQGVVEGDTHAVEAYLAAGGDPARQLTAEECKRLSRPRVFEMNYTLVHLAIRFQREDMLAVLLTTTDVVTKAKKRVPSHVAPDVATDIIREISMSLRQRKGDFPCYFLTEMSSFALPADIEDLPNPIKKQLFDEIMDRGVQKDLEDEEPVINWSGEMTDRLGSRLYVLWNRTAGDCLLDSVLQATWGVMDRDNTLRRALADSLCDGANMFYPRWKDTEAMQAQSLHFSLDESQWQQDWAILLSIASQPGSSLEQIHIFALSHILRRPIIVYGIKYVKSFRGENLGLARFQGVYLPLLWERSFCWKSPIALGYTRGHFSALVAMEIDSCDVGAGAHLDNNDEAQITYLPLMDYEGKMLQIHFLSPSELGHEESILKGWLDVCVTSGGLCVAQQRLTKPPLLVHQMVDEWLDRYRRLAHVVQGTAPTQRTTHNMVLPPGVATETLSTDDETDDE